MSGFLSCSCPAQQLWIFLTVADISFRDAQDLLCRLTKTNKYSMGFFSNLQNHSICVNDPKLKSLMLILSDEKTENDMLVFHPICVEKTLQQPLS